MFRNYEKRVLKRGVFLKQNHITRTLADVSVVDYSVQGAVQLDHFLAYVGSQDVRVLCLRIAIPFNLIEILRLFLARLILRFRIGRPNHSF